MVTYEHLATTPEIADDLGLTRQQVVNLIKDGTLTAVKDDKGRYRLDRKQARAQYAAKKRFEFSSRWPDSSKPGYSAHDLTPQEWLSIVTEVDSWYDWGARVELHNCAYRISQRVCEVDGLPDNARPEITAAIREEIYSSLKALETFDGTICADMPQREACPRFGCAETCEVLENGGDCYGNGGDSEALCFAEVIHFAEYFEESDTFKLHDPINPDAFGGDDDTGESDRGGTGAPVGV
ncbi:MAG: hypothetical protein IJ087_11015 [Eggerthellaceae bacterium]|nr:hypothetical protein [Eggerthellaceae bacterium]